MSTTSTIPIYQKYQQKHAIDKILSLPESGQIPQPIDWQEENRYLPPEVSPEHYGQFDRNLVPHFIEPLNRLHPDDPTTHLTLMKSVQSAGTVTLIEGGMGFATRYKLGSCLFFTSNKGIGKIRSSSALDPLIDNANLADLLSPISSRMKRKTSDTTFYKEFAGGIRWLITSYNSIGDMKSNTFGMIFCDEWDEAGVELKDQGDIAGIIEGRTMGLRFYKIVYISTPTRMETSRIYKAFIEGDQRRYHVPCPLCGAPQILELKSRDQKYGLTFNRQKNPKTGAKTLDHSSIRYICKHCEREWYESQKIDMLIQAQERDDAGWIPTWQQSDHRPLDEYHKSYHAQGLISPFLPWRRICQQFINTRFGEDIMLFKDFMINYLGNPWARIQQKASWEDLRDRAEDYTLGEVPDGPLRLYGGVDVQGDRLELAVIGIGPGMEKWLIDYQVFWGNPHDITDLCYQNLSTYCYSTKYMILQRPVSISLVLMDSGFDPKDQYRREKDWDSKGHTVYNFVGPRQDLFVAIKGAGELKIHDIVRPARVYDNSLLTKRIDISTPIIKEILMQHIDRPSGPNAIHFPKWRIDGGIKRYIGDHVFMQFLSERYQEIKPGVMGWHKVRERNEVWDTVIYASSGAYLEGVNRWEQSEWDRYREAILEK